MLCGCALCLSMELWHTNTGPGQLLCIQPLVKQGAEPVFQVTSPDSWLFPRACGGAEGLAEQPLLQPDTTLLSSKHNNLNNTWLIQTRWQAGRC